MSAKIWGGRSICHTESCAPRSAWSWQTVKLGIQAFPGGMIALDVWGVTLELLLKLVKEAIYDYSGALGVILSSAVDIHLCILTLCMLDGYLHWSHEMYEEFVWMWLPSVNVTPYCTSARLAPIIGPKTTMLPYPHLPQCLKLVQKLRSGSTKLQMQPIHVKILVKIRLPKNFASQFPGCDRDSTETHLEAT